MENYLEREVKSLQERFNSHYRGRTVFDLRTRQMLMFGILGLGILIPQIDTEVQPPRRQLLIQDFMKKRLVLREAMTRLERISQKSVSQMRKQTTASFRQTA